MQPKNDDPGKLQDDLFRSKLVNLIDHRHPLFILADQLDWSMFEDAFGPLYVEDVGRPGIPIRIMVGLHYLKHTYDESDESVVEKFYENPYWQYFCGFEYFQHKSPIDPSSMTRWRNRLGGKRIEKLLKETIEAAKRMKFLKASDSERVNVDTTVQEKAIAFPTDARLYHKMRRKLVQEAGRQPRKAFCDRGYRGVPDVIGGTTIHLAGKRVQSRALLRWMRRRSAIEPVIGHMKADHGMERNHLKGREGDMINATLSGCGFNLRKLMRAFALAAEARGYFLLSWIRYCLLAAFNQAEKKLPLAV